ncbi:MAG: OsmC family protein [Bacteroidia bacterium]
MVRTGTANWQGSGKEGSGTVSTQSKVLNNNQYSWQSRFAEGIGTNPEELIAAAHAGCFSMKLSFVLGAAGFTPESIDTKCSITLDDGSITKSHLEVAAKVPGITAEKFTECAAEAKASCPVSKSIKAEITIEAKLLELVS